VYDSTSYSYRQKAIGKKTKQSIAQNSLAKSQMAFFHNRIALTHSENWPVEMQMEINQSW
jgi:hypothetical protein